MGKRSLTVSDSSLAVGSYPRGRPCWKMDYSTSVAQCLAVGCPLPSSCANTSTRGSWGPPWRGRLRVHHGHSARTAGRRLGVRGVRQLCLAVHRFARCRPRGRGHRIHVPPAPLTAGRAGDSERGLLSGDIGIPSGRSAGRGRSARGGRESSPRAGCCPSDRAVGEDG
jgi:hypothetical protein